MTVTVGYFASSELCHEIYEQNFICCQDIVRYEWFLIMLKRLY